MMQKKKKWLALFIVLIMAVGMIPLGGGKALAAWDGSSDITWYGDGSAASFTIGTAAELAGFAAIVNGTAAGLASDSFASKTITLTGNIDLSGATDWTPIGTIGAGAKPFSGTFDGGGYQITGLQIGTAIAKNNTLNTLGLFGNADGSAVIRNTGVEVAIYSSVNMAYIGGLAGYSNADIENCHTVGTISGGYKSYVGGLAGCTGAFADYTANGKISNSYSTCSVTVEAGGASVGSANVGGLIGYNQKCEIIGSHATGAVSCGNGALLGETPFLGGLVASSESAPVTDCYATGNVTAGDFSLAGGLMGFSSATITGCYADGTVVAGNDSDAGGFVGSQSSGTIRNSHATGNVSIGNCTDADSQIAAGGFAARSGNLIDGCYATGAVTAGDAVVSASASQWTVYAGGFAGLSSGLNASITDSYAMGTVAAGDAAIGGVYSDSTGIVNAGGFAGKIDAVTVSGCHAGGAVTAGVVSLPGSGVGNTYAVYAGGFAGYVYGSKQSAAHVTRGSVINNWSRGAVSGGQAATLGGFAGGSVVESRWAYVSFTLIANCYATGAVTGSTSLNIGGFAGYNYYGTIENCYGAGSMTSGGSTNSGAFAGQNEAFGGTALIINGYYNTVAGSGIALNSGGTDLTIGLSGAVMTGGAGAISYYTDSAGTPAANPAGTFVQALNYGITVLHAEDSSVVYSLWAADSGAVNGGYPVFAGNWQDAGKAANAFAGGSGTAADPYRITNAAQLAYLTKLLNSDDFMPDGVTLKRNVYKDKNYLLDNDIDLSGSQWTPIGKSSGTYTFAGTFDGGGHTISGLTIGTDEVGDLFFSDAGLFGSAESPAVIKNTGVAVNIHASGNSGGLVSSNDGLIENCWATGSIRCGDFGYIGGLVGYNQGKIRNSYARCLVHGDDDAYAGGLIGVNIYADATLPGLVQNCYATGNVDSGATAAAGGSAGGCVGMNAEGTLQNCYATGTAGGSGGTTVGGFAGGNISIGGSAVAFQNAYYNSTANPAGGTGAGSAADGSTGLTVDVMKGMAAPAGGITYAVSATSTATSAADSGAFVQTLNGGIALLGSAATFMSWEADDAPLSNSGYPLLSAGSNVPAGDNNGGNNGGGGGGGTAISNSASLIDLNGTSYDPATIDTGLPSATLEAGEKDGSTVVSFPAKVLEALAAKNPAFLLNIRTSFGSYQLPVNIVTQMEGLQSLLAAYGLTTADIGFRITLTDLSRSQKAENKGLLADVDLGTVIDIKVEVFNLQTGSTLGKGTFTIKSLPVIAAAKTVQATPVFTGIAGSNRYDTAARIAQECFPQGTDTVILARGDLAADALTAGPLAGKYGAPLLLTAAGILPAETLNAIHQLKAKTVVVMGGTGAISQGVADALSSQIPGISIRRIAGGNRYETAFLAATLLAQAEAAIIVSAGDTGYADALSVTAWAANRQAPVLYAEPASARLPQATAMALQKLNIGKTILIGGTAILPRSLEQELPQPVRYGGQDRFETNALVLQALQPAPLNVFMATGLDYADALAASAAAGQSGGCLLLTGNGELSPSQAQYLQTVKSGVNSILICGGKNAVGEETLNAVRKILEH